MRKFMSFLGGLVVAIGLVSPAAADWTTNDYFVEDKLYMATDMDEDGNRKFEVACNAGAGVIEVTLYTGEAYDPKTSNPDKVPISITTDSRTQPIVAAGYFQDFHGDLIVHSDSGVDPAWYRILDPVAVSEAAIKVEVDHREYRLSTKGFSAAMDHLREKCS